MAAVEHLEAPNDGFGRARLSAAQSGAGECAVTGGGPVCRASLDPTDRAGTHETGDQGGSASLAETVVSGRDVYGARVVLPSHSFPLGFQAL